MEEHEKLDALGRVLRQRRFGEQIQRVGRSFLETVAAHHGLDASVVTVVDFLLLFVDGATLHKDEENRRG